MFTRLSLPRTIANSGIDREPDRLNRDPGLGSTLPVALGIYNEIGFLFLNIQYIYWLINPNTFQLPRDLSAIFPGLEK